MQFRAVSCGFVNEDQDNLPLGKVLTVKAALVPYCIYQAIAKLNGDYRLAGLVEFAVVVLACVLGEVVGVVPVAKQRKLGLSNSNLV